jgi:hypothetical protein
VSICNYSTQEAGAGGSQFEAILSYIVSPSKNKKPHTLIIIKKAYSYYGIFNNMTRPYK